MGSTSSGSARAMRSRLRRMAGCGGGGGRTHDYPCVSGTPTYPPIRLGCRVVGACYCGVDASATCQACGHRVCTAHSVQERTVDHFVAPDDELLSWPWFRALRLVAEYGYAAGRGARCPVCRNADAMAAVRAIPRDWPGDPIEKRVWQYTHFGAYAPLDPGWGKAWVEAAKRRGLPPDSYSLAHRRWAQGRKPEVEGRAVWEFTKIDAGQVSWGVEYKGGTTVLLRLDDEGRSPVFKTETVPGPFRRRKRVVQSLAWERGPVPTNRQRLERSDLDSVLLSLIDTRIPMVWARQDDVSYLGLPPNEVFAWLTSHASR